MICPKCNTKNLDTNSKCSTCGTSLSYVDEFDSGSGMKTVVGMEGVESSLKKGTLFAGRYEFLEDGLKGGMGMVYKVKDNTLGKIKALKIVLPAYLENEKALSRFKQEVSITQELLHENIVRVYDIGEAEGTFYFTMEWIDGISMRDFINERKKQNKYFSLEEAANLTKQICSALSYAHKMIVHRDIKPENILILDPTSKEPKVKITDFGIAKMESQSIHASTSTYVGTPIYMAPEQYTDASHVDKRADVYSVGVVFYELLTFLHPLGTFPMPSEVNPSIPKKVDEIIKKALSTAKTKRYDDAMDIVKALEAPVVETVPVQETPVEKQEAKIEKPTVMSVKPQVVTEKVPEYVSSQSYAHTTAPQPRKKNPVIMVAIIGLVVILGGFFAFSSMNKNKVEQDKKEISQKEEEIKEAARKAEEATKKAEIERQKAEAVRSEAKENDQQALLQYFQEGKDYFNKGKYELCIEKMKEVLKRDRNNHEAEQYISSSKTKLDDAKRQFKNLHFGRSE